MSERFTFLTLPAWHRQTLLRLMQDDFPGRQEVQQQLESAEYELVGANGSLQIFPRGAPIAPVKKRIPVEAYSFDRDETVVMVLLFTRRGFVSRLEILRGDGAPLQKRPEPDDLNVTVLSS
jgi:hypothetical protein